MDDGDRRPVFLHSRDRLISINGAPLKTWPELRAKLQSLRLGDTVQVRVQRDQPFRQPRVEGPAAYASVARRAPRR